MTDLRSFRSKAILVGLFCSFAWACSNTAPAPAVERPGSGGSKTGGTSGTAGGGSSGTGGSVASGGSAAGGSASGGAPVDNTGGSAGSDAGEVVDTAPETAPEDVLPAPDAPGCTNPCNTNRKRCNNDVVQDCVMVNGCPTWHDATTCTLPQICTQPTVNTAACSCQVSCTPGRKRCNSAGMLEECAMAAGATCPAWVNPTACASPMACVMAGNSASCSCPQGPCGMGEKRCAGGGLQECKAAGAGTCPNWQAAVACPANKEYTDPVGNQPADCRCKPVCTPGHKKCDTGGLSECVNVDGCPAWKTTACPNAGVCVMGNGTTTANCGCPADTCKIGDKTCKGIGILQECKGTGPGGCGQLEDTTCNNGRFCATGPDVQGKKTASCSCPDGSCGQGDQRCDNTGVHQICEASGGRCGVWINAPCTSPNVCTKNTTGNPSACGCPMDSCPVNSHKCSADNKTVQLCSGECGQTTSVFDDCDAKGQVCSRGQCVTVACDNNKKCDKEGDKRCFQQGGKQIGEICQKTTDKVCPLLFVNVVTCDGNAPKCETKPGAAQGSTPPVGPVCCADTPCAPTCVTDTQGKSTFHGCKWVNGCFVEAAPVLCERTTTKCAAGTGCIQ